MMRAAGRCFLQLLRKSDTKPTACRQASVTFCCYCRNTAMQEVQFTVSQRAIRSVFAGANGRYSHCRKMGVPVCHRASPPVTKRHWARPCRNLTLGENLAPQGRFTTGFCTRRTLGYHVGARAGVWTRFRTRRAFGRQDDVRRPVLAASTRREEAHHHSAGASSLGASDEWCARSGPLGAW